MLADDDRCWLCGKHGANTADHEIPLSRGGTNHRTNLRPAHKSCNSSRGNRPA
ncbi:HNH endonuclease [Micromonospora andamanensis]|uniref:HNH endonuclease n=1 Tax=Micromonospora andamanensis TaxID=1287068 RepID=UPI00194EAFF5